MDLLNQTLGKYKLTKLLGEGGMSHVYLAEHETLGIKVAIKLLKSDFVSHPNVRKRFLAEARNLAKMQHSNVVKVTDLIDAGDIVAFVMEYIDGISLEEYITQKAPLSNSTIEQLFPQMVEAVNYVHSQGLIHRDIKPSNFMVSNEGTIILLDFGIAKNLNDSGVDYTKTGLMQQIGTPMFMSPEQVRNTSEITQQTDIYSLGVVLWQMVMNKKPFDSDELTLPEIQVLILKEDLPLTNTQWDIIIQKATKKALYERYQSGIELITDFKNKVYLDPRAMKSIQKAGGDKSRPLDDKSKNKTMILGSLILIIGGFVTWQLIANKETEVKITDTTHKFAPDTVVIGSQIWMKYNLDVITFRNGDTIPQALTGNEFIDAGKNKKPAWCYYKNDSEYGKKYGKLYNWYAVNDPRGLAPEGYHIPSDKEWTVLTDFFGGEKVAGKKMKSTTGWIDNGNGTDEVGFGALPGGICLGEGTFSDAGRWGYWWSGTSHELNKAFILALVSDDTVYKIDSGVALGLSVRCIKD